MSQASELLEACYKGNLEAVEQILRDKPDLANLPGSPDQWESATSLALAALAGHLEIARLLLEKGANVNPVSNDGSALLMAVWGGHEPMVQLLLEAGADTNKASASGETALMAAAFKGFVQIGRLLIKNHANVNAQTTNGTTDFFMTSPPVCGESPLHLAAGYGHREFVLLLIEAGADSELVDHSQQKPIHWAARHQHNEIIALLKKR